MTPPNLSLIFVMICFWMTFWLVQKFLIGPVGQVLAERKHRISTATETWEAKHAEFEAAIAKVEEQFDVAAREAAKVREDLRRQANESRQQMLASAREQADARLDEAMTQLDQQATTARNELREHARELAALFATQLLERKVTS
jgi:F-type H+-transporting ATPase subunit b